MFAISFLFLATAAPILAQFGEQTGQQPARRDGIEVEAMMDAGRSFMSLLGASGSEVDHKLEAIRDCSSAVATGWADMMSVGSCTDAEDIPFTMTFAMWLVKVIGAGGTGELTAADQNMMAQFHQKQAKVCNKQQGCDSFMKQYTPGIARCYTGMMCSTFWRDVVPYEVCYRAQGNYWSMVFNDSATMGPMCTVEPSTGAFCGEVDYQLLINMRCFQEIIHPFMGCSPECWAAWLRHKANSPVCAAQFAERLFKNQGRATKMVQEMMQEPRIQQFRSRTPQNLCQDLTLQAVAPQSQDFWHITV